MVGAQIRQAVQNGTQFLVVDPRDIGLAKSAAVHLKLRPGTNVAFANGMMNVFISEGLIDEEFIKTRTEGFEEAELKAEAAGIIEDSILRQCRTIAAGRFV